MLLIARAEDTGSPLLPEWRLLQQATKLSASLSQESPRLDCISYRGTGPSPYLGAVESQKSTPGLGLDLKRVNFT